MDEKRLDGLHRIICASTVEVRTGAHRVSANCFPKGRGLVLYLSATEYMSRSSISSTMRVCFHGRRCGK
jgi:hypothetical protein